MNIKAAIPPSLTRADEAFDCLQTAIVKGDLAPGEKIGEVELLDHDSSSLSEIQMASFHHYLSLSSFA